MSWSVIVPKSQPDGGVTTPARFISDASEAWDSSAHDEPTNQAFQTAVEAAAAILTSGEVGPGNGGYTVQMGGHANPNHLPAPPAANDYVTITVTQARVPA